VNREFIEKAGRDIVAHHLQEFSITLAYNTKSQAEVDQVLAIVAHLGAPIIKPAQQVFWGSYSGYFADPDGHLWEVAWNPFFAFDESDNLLLP
jgi:uncharacterized glyoxalase superfamily protein PhnB